MIIVPNEWIVDLLMGMLEEQRKVHRFLDKVEAEGHILSVRYHGALGRKLRRVGVNHWPQVRRLGLLLWDLEKIDLVGEHEITALPEEWGREVPGDDVYLVETAYSRASSLLVTTDRSLWEILRGGQWVSVQMLDEFLAQG